MKNRSTWGRVAIVTILVVWTGCRSQHAPSDEAEWIPEASLLVSNQPLVDLLFVIDTSPSMTLESDVVGGRVGGLVQELLEFPDGIPSRYPMDLHVAVVTSDMGNGGFSSTCESPSDGDAGAFQSLGRLEGCQQVYNAVDCPTEECPWLSFPQASHSVECRSIPDVRADVECMATFDAEGCSPSQPLNALMSVLPRVESNEGPFADFRRDNAFLQVIIITDGDDCSVLDSQLFDPNRTDFGPMPSRCANNPELLVSLEHVYDVIVGAAGRGDNAGFAVIAGVPTDGTWNPGDSLVDLRELVRFDADDEPITTCASEVAEASVPARLAELVYMFGNNGVLESICQPDWSGALQVPTRWIGPRLMDGWCLEPDAPSFDERACRVVETLEGSGRCPYDIELSEEERCGPGWQVDEGLDSQGNRRCLLLPADRDGDGQPDPALEGSESECTLGDGQFASARIGACQPGWVRVPGPNGEWSCDGDELLFTRALEQLFSAGSTITFECQGL